MENQANMPPVIRKRNDKGRRCWSSREEEVLLAGLKEIIANEWKSDNGFRVGYLQALEAHLRKEIPGTNLKAMPHINSKIHGWKKNYGSLFSMLSKSGIGWNPTTKMIESSDEAWESYLKIDSNAKIMRFKSWPFYDDWCEIFGKDRATGLDAEGFSDAVNGVLNQTQPSGLVSEVDLNGSNFLDLDSLFDDVAPTPTTDDMSVSQPPHQAESSKKSAGKKRKATEESDPLCEILGEFYERADARLGEIARRIGYDQDMAAAREKVWAAVEGIDRLTLKEKVIASMNIAQSAEDLVLFFTLPPHAREEFVMLKLHGNF